MTAPRIYNLFPLLAGPVPRWRDHLDRVARMNFDWIYLNPIQYAGFSGSLYAIKDPYAYHAVLSEGLSVDQTQPSADPRSLIPSFERHLRGFIAEAAERGIRVMLDLVVNHTSKDALLTTLHPEWYLRETDGTIRSPFAIDPADARRITVWGDLAELNWEDPASRDGLVAYWSDFVRHVLDLGFAGFRCDAAYKVPAEVWVQLIAAARTVRADALFCAETLGCRLPEVQAVTSAGFDLLFNSAKWWDFRAPWCLEQYEAHRHIAPSISFPETHDTPRLAAETNGNEALLRQRYLFAAFFSSGLLMPIGFEYGARRQLDVARTRISDREPVACDLTDYIRDVNALKTSLPVLQEEGPIDRLGDDGPIVRLRKRSNGQHAPVLGWINTTDTSAAGPIDEAEEALGAPRDRIVMAGSSAVSPSVGPREEAFRPLAPHEVRLLGVWM